MRDLISAFSGPVSGFPAPFGRRGSWSPTSLFASSEAGALYLPGPDTCFQDAAGTIPAGDGDPIGYVSDLSGNGNHATQSTSAARPTLRQDAGGTWSAELDRVDDNLAVTFPADVTGTWLIVTGAGFIAAEVDIAAGAWHWATYRAVYDEYFPDSDVIAMVVIDRTLSASEIAQVRAWAGAGSFAPVGNLSNQFRYRPEITSIDATDWDMSAITKLGATFYGNPGLTGIDISSWDLSALTNMSSCFAGSTSLASIEIGDGSVFSDSPCTVYGNVLQNVPLLPQADLDAILVAIEAAGTSGGTFNQSLGAAPSATGEAAIDALRLRGWTVTVEGGY